MSLKTGDIINTSVVSNSGSVSFIKRGKWLILGLTAFLYLKKSVALMYKGQHAPSRIISTIFRVILSQRTPCSLLSSALYINAILLFQSDFIILYSTVSFCCAEPMYFVYQCYVMIYYRNKFSYG